MKKNTLYISLPIKLLFILMTTCSSYISAMQHTEYEITNNTDSTIEVQSIITSPKVPVKNICERLSRQLEQKPSIYPLSVRVKTGLGIRVPAMPNRTYCMIIAGTSLLIQTDDNISHVLHCNALTPRSVLYRGNSSLLILQQPDGSIVYASKEQYNQDLKQPKYLAAMLQRRDNLNIPVDLLRVVCEYIRPLIYDAKGIHSL